jgi:hypothetical protein
MTLLKKIAYVTSFFPLLIVLALTGCENNPNDLGLTFINPNDTAGSKILDTTYISSNNYRRYINSNGSQNMLVGYTVLSGNQYYSRSLIQFNGITGNYLSPTVVSASLRLKYSKYAFKDTTGQVSFNIYRVNKKFDLTTVTNDSVGTSDIGSTSLGSYTGSPTNSNAINITLDNQTMKDWLSYAADTNYSVKNYGLAFVPNSGSNTIKGFYSGFADDTLKPIITVVVQTTTSFDTLTFGTSTSASLSDAPLSSIPTSQYFVVQNGIAFRDILKFNFSSQLPANATINEAYLQITLNSAQSYITSGTSNQIKVDMITDSSTKASNDESFYLTRLDSITYTVRINQIVQRWISGLIPNYGVVLKCPSEKINLDNFVFYGPDNADVSKRPRIRVRYTPRQQ